MKKKKNELAVLVKAIDNVPVCSTLDMCQPLGVEHHAIVQLVKKYELQLKEIGPVAFQMRVGTRGGTPISYCYLDEEQTTFLITLMKNSEPVVQFKYRLSREFYRMKNEITRIQAIARNNNLNIEWTEARQSGKQDRRQETDSIQRFIEYAIGQGSKSAQKYYMLFSKMANSLMFDMQTGAVNTRDVCNVNQLGSLKVVDTIISRALEEDMACGIYYKEIYRNTKVKIQQFVSLYGRSEIPGTLQIGM
jgi:phage regulator Rha-like protein